MAANTEEAKQRAPVVVDSADSAAETQPHTHTHTHAETQALKGHLRSALGITQQMKKDYKDLMATYEKVECVCVCVYVCMCMYVCVCVCVCVCMCVCVRMRR